MRRRAYPRDPYWTIARFDSECSGCGEAIRTGERIFYYPQGKAVYSGGCAKRASREFEAARFDEAAMTGGW